MKELSNEQEIIEKYLMLKGKVVTRVKKLSKSFNLPEAVIYEILRENGFFCEKCREFTAFKHDEAVEYYKTHEISIRDLAKMFNTSYYTMYNTLRAMELKRPENRRNSEN